MTAWSAGALYYSSRGGSRTGAVLAITFVLATIVAFVLLPRRRRTLVGFFVAFGAVLVWCFPFYRLFRA